MIQYTVYIERFFEEIYNSKKKFFCKKIGIHFKSFCPFLAAFQMCDKMNYERKRNGLPPTFQYPNQQ